jgi:ACS family tartrate transporter-like MFS transporter
LAVLVAVERSPSLFLLYIVAHLDRIIISFAALQMNENLGFSAAIYGFGAGSGSRGS